MLIFAAIFTKNNMKKYSLGLAVMLLALASCGGKTKELQHLTGANEYDVEEEAADGIQRMHDYHFSDTLRAGGRVYQYTIDRITSDSLSVVTDDDGRRYADNIYTLTLQSGGTTVFKRQFTKGAFASYLSKEFQQKGILDGMMCDKSLPGMSFAVSVSLPQSDLFEPLILQVDASGGISIRRDERGEVEYEPEGDGV